MRNLQVFGHMLGEWLDDARKGLAHRSSPQGASGGYRMLYARTHAKNRDGYPDGMERSLLCSPVRLISVWN